MKTKRILLLISLGLILLFGTPANSQNVEAISSIPTDSILIGQQLPLEIQISLPEQFIVKWPVWGDTLVKNIEITGVEEPVRLKSTKAGHALYRYRMNITTFDTGFYYLPAIPIGFSTGTDSVFYEALTNPLMIYVGSVDVDTNQAFRPIKEPLKVPITFAELLPWILGLLALGLIIFLIIRYLVKRSSRLETITEKPVPSLAPHLLALEQFEELRHSKLWQSGRTKDYYTRLSEIVRTYIENQFSLMAVEMTTDEILMAIGPLRINPDAGKKLASSLQLADLVKFAKAQPSALENDLCLQHLIDFVNESYGNFTAVNTTPETEVINENQANR